MSDYKCPCGNILCPDPGIKSLEAERDRLKTELRGIKRCPQCKVNEGELHTEYCCLNLWKSKAEKLAEAFKKQRNATNETDCHDIREEALAEFDALRPATKGSNEKGE